MSSVEEAAVRLKLDQKISQGRNLIMLDLSTFNVDDAPSVRCYQTLVTYLFARSVHAAVSGLKKATWQKIVIPGAKDIQKFETELEATKWFEEVSKAPAENPDQKKEAPKPPPDPEKEFKDKKLRELLAKYEIYQLRQDYDPHMLRKYQEEYKALASRPALVALKKAYEDIATASAETKTLNEKGAALAAETKMYMQIRKIPMSPAELQNMKKAIERNRNEVQSEVDTLKANIQKSNTAIDEFKSKSADHKKTWEAKLTELKKQIVFKKEENTRVLKQIEKADKEEEAVLKSLPAPQAPKKA